MGQVAISLNGRSYQLACEDGQEEHLRALGDELDRRIADLVAKMGQIGDMRLVIMAALIVADELADARASLTGRRPPATSGAPGPGAEEQARAAEKIAAGVESLAARIESIAGRLAQP
ncbi:MAG: cell division protein ZapA [Alphaproteobacteria bacterium]